MTPEEQEAAAKAAEEKAAKDAAKKAAKEEAAAKAADSPYKKYEECKVEVSKDEKGEYVFEKGKVLRDNVKLEPFRVDILNEQSHNSKIRYYEQK